MITFNEPIGQPWFAPRWKLILRIKPFDRTLAKKLAAELFERHLKGHRLAGFEEFLKLCLMIDQIGGQAELHKDYYLINLIENAWAMSGELSERDADYLVRKADELRLDPLTEWFYPKVMQLLYAVRHHAMVLNFARGILVPSGIIGGLFEALEHHVGSVRGLVSDFAKELFQRQQYGVKSSYYEDGVLHRPGQAWVMLNPEPITVHQMSNEKRSIGADRLLCLTGLVRKKSLRSLDLQFRPDLKSELLDRIEFPFESWIMMGIDREGELVGIPHPAGMAVKEVFVDQGKELIYELIRMTCLLRAFNLVVPLEVVKAVPALPPPPKSPFGRLLSGIRQPVKDLIKADLIVPRIRWFEERRQELKNLLEEEFAADAAETERRLKRSIRQHKVEFFTRQLPSGHRASPEAVARARQYLERPLEPHETFVRPHFRGSFDQIVKRIHRAVSRRRSPEPAVEKS